ncbi:S-adenosyl-L-methionine-dependent methyltransferase [Thamnocephalis sphaerospora]|uniref:S-adenosyl-L-methionine-dependent methyltransferase n=1 Tax=Thamnocephalis sphaerospora TaxID=78915 RepID=A0A4P9XNM7_9FUNG|nr:S-adenosyl-L-methionine-dependent methyltransferase [Thamnocephalis sphaerospora]|eukprot:RKP07432.1 S-adenosyl-L-methionine-dependent methyltransferase [Thamnocephalis sphaerospora]
MSFRYELYHYIVKHVLGSNCPIANDMTLNRVLDVGTGTGLWALDMAREFPASKIYGCDVAPVIDNSQTRPNIYWGNADLLRGLPYSDNSFDLVHQRQLCVYIGERQWPLVARELYRLCRPGGKLCLIELLPTVTVASDIVSWHDCELSGRVAAVRCINDLIQQTLHKSGVRPEAVACLGDLLSITGFANVRHDTVELPRGDWAGQLGRCMLSYTHKLLIATVPAVAASTDTPRQEYEDMIEHAMPVLALGRASHRLHVFTAEKPLQ